MDLQALARIRMGTGWSLQNFNTEDDELMNLVFQDLFPDLYEELYQNLDLIVKHKDGKTVIK